MPDRIRRLLVCAVLLAGHAASAGGEAMLPHSDQLVTEWTLDRVVASLKEERESSVSFFEKTHSSLLTEPLMTRGMLRFIPPSRLEKEVLEPYRERYVIEGDMVVFESERKHIKKTISLEDYPGLRSVVEAFRAGFTGDATKLKQVYETTVTGDRRQWALLLRPRDEPAKSLIDHILLSGSEGRLTTITVHGRDGDRSVMTLLRGSAR